MQGATESSCSAPQRPYRVMRSSASTADTSPIVIAEPVGHVGAVLDVPQIFGVGDFLADIVARLFAQAAQLFPATGQIVAVEEAATERLDPDAAARSAEFVDPLEQQILPVGRQVGE